MIIVCFLPGLAGDLVSAVIDSKNCYITDNGKVEMNFFRKTLKRSLTKLTTLQKDKFVEDIQTKYKSVPSHDIDYHATKHDFITIGIRDESLYEYAMMRCLLLNFSNVGELSLDNHKEEHKKFLSHAKHILYFDDILNGKLIEKLEPLCDNLDVEFYAKWLKHWDHR